MKKDDGELEEFGKELMLTVKIHKKNKILGERMGKNVEKLGFDSDEFEKNTRNRMRKGKSKEIAQNDYGTQRFDSESCFVWFIVNGKSLRNIVPDGKMRFIEKNYALCKENHENCFEMGKLQCHLQDYHKAIEFFSLATRYSQFNPKYELWNSIIALKVVKNPSDLYKNSLLPCCNDRAKVSPKSLFMEKLLKLEKIPENIESLWGMMELSQNSLLKPGKNVQNSRFYASKIKNLDNYYGYLAWAKIFLKEKNENAIKILLNLIETYPKGPEAYYLAWDYYFANKDYQRCKDIAAEAFLLITDGESLDYYIIFCLRFAKSYFFIGNLPHCLEILVQKYFDHPDFTIFLYSFAKYCVKSEDQVYTGVARGTLKELVRLSHTSGLGLIYYWLCRICIFSRHFDEAHCYSLKAVINLPKSEKKKLLEMQTIYLEMKPDIEKIEKIRENIQAKTFPDAIFEKCEEIKDFHKPTGDILHAEVLFAKGSTEEALVLLRKTVNSSRYETNSYFKLLELDPSNAENTFEGLLARAKDVKVPAQVWSKANLLYAKYKFKSNDYKIAFSALKMLAKMVPPLPNIEIPYCRYLQDTENSLENDFALTSLKKNSGTRRKSFFNARENDFLTEKNILNEKKAENVHKKKIQKKFDSIGMEIDLNNEETKGEDMKNFKENPILAFSLCSKPKFLYYIAKFSLRLNQNKEEALLALADYIELVKIGKNQEKTDRNLGKAFKLRVKIENLE